MNINIPIHLETMNDHYLFEYVEDIIQENPMKYSRMEFIRPSEFVFDRLNERQKKLHMVLFGTNDEDNRECPICYTDFDDYNTVRTNCNHLFCKDCILKVIDHGNHSCPYCRTPLKSYFELFVAPSRVILSFVFVPCLVNFYHRQLYTFYRKNRTWGITSNRRWTKY